MSEHQQDITESELQAIYDQVDAELAQGVPTDQQLLHEIEAMNEQTGQ